MGATSSLEGEKRGFGWAAGKPSGCKTGHRMAPSEKDRMLAGELYRADDAQLVAERRRCQSLLRSYNDELDQNKRSELLGKLLGHAGKGAVIESPVACDYGYNISVGADTFVNYGAIFLDVVPLTIGDHVQIGTAVQILTAEHPRDPELRRSGAEFGSPVTIEDDVWVGSGAIICPGASVGANTVIGAGSVVTKAIPPDVVAAGNPCRVMRSL
jgi:maltose O-acetyltransferase